MEYYSILPAVQGLDVHGLEASSLNGLENFFHQAYAVENSARLMSAMVIHKIITHELFKPEYDNLYTYLKAAPDRLSISPQTASSLYYSADFFLAHHKALVENGFKVIGDFSKLRHAHIACNHHPVADVIKAVCSMSFREFLAFTFPSMPSALVDKELKVESDKVMAGGKTLFTLDSVRKILAAGEIPALMGFVSQTEKKAVEKFLKDRRAGN